MAEGWGAAAFARGGETGKRAAGERGDGCLPLEQGEFPVTGIQSWETAEVTSKVYSEDSGLGWRPGSQLGCWWQEQGLGGGTSHTVGELGWGKREQAQRVGAASGRWALTGHPLPGGFNPAFFTVLEGTQNPRI